MESSYTYLLVGGGVAAVSAAQTIRETDSSGAIALLGDDAHPPYDRPPLSKNMLSDDSFKPDDAESKYPDFYPKNRVELHTRTHVKSIDRANRKVTLESGEQVGYEKLLLATGSRPNPLPVAGGQRQGVHLLRSMDDSIAIRDALRRSRRVVIVGAGYIGVEVASGAVGHGKEVTIIEKSGHPWSRFASPELGQFIRHEYQKRGVRVLVNDEVAEIEGQSEAGPVSAVRTASGERVQADMVVAGLGVSLNIELARKAGLEVTADGVQVNEFLQTGDPHIWAAGDIACFQDIAMGKRWHLEHHLNAQWQGKAVGRIMAGGREPYNQVPYFFSDELDIHMILRGDPWGGRHTVVAGDMEAGEFIEFYHGPDGRLAMGIAISHDEKGLDPISDALEQLIRHKLNVKEHEGRIRAPGFQITSLPGAGA